MVLPKMKAGPKPLSLRSQNAYGQTQGGRLSRNLVVRREFDGVPAGTVECEAEGHWDKLYIRGYVLVDEAGKRLSGCELALFVADLELDLDLGLLVLAAVEADHAEANV